MALQPDLVELIPLPARSGFGMSALATFISKFQRPKLPVGLPKSLALRMDIGLDGRRCFLQLAAARDDRDGIAAKMNALTLLPLAGNFPLASEVLFDPETLAGEIVSLTQQSGKSPSPVIDGRLGHAHQALKFGGHIPYCWFGGSTPTISRSAARDSSSVVSSPLL